MNAYDKLIIEMLSTATVLTTLIIITVKVTVKKSGKRIVNH